MCQNVISQLHYDLPYQLKKVFNNGKIMKLFLSSNIDILGLNYGINKL